MLKSINTSPVMIFPSSQHIWTHFLEDLAVGWHVGIALTIWSRFWMRFVNISDVLPLGRHGSLHLTRNAPSADYNSQGYIAPSATIHHANLQLGANVFIGDRVIFQLRTAAQWRAIASAYIVIPALRRLVMAAA